jgi:hypothetical protein
VPNIKMELYMRCLVVDDSEDSRDLTESIVTSAGYEHVHCPQSAWETFELLDIMWPPKTYRPRVDLVRSRNADNGRH